MKKAIAYGRIVKPDRRHRLSVMHAITGQERETPMVFTRSEVRRQALLHAAESPFLVCRIQSV